VNLPKLLSFESGRIVFFETLTKHPENWQQNPTPLCIVRKMLDKTSLEEKKILVLFNIEFLQVLVEERKINPENIYYIADNELEYLSAIKIFKVQSYKLSDFSVPALKKLIAGLDMKFDVVFSNPPYNKNIDIKILNEIFDIADEFIVIHPSGWLIDIKEKTSFLEIFKRKIEKDLKAAEFFNGNPVFNIRLFMPCLITHIDKKHKGQIEVKYFDEYFETSEIKNITKYGTKWTTLVEHFKEKICNYIENNHGSMWDRFSNNKTNNFVEDKGFLFQMPMGRGDEDKVNSSKMVKDNFYGIFSCNINEIETKNKNQKIHFTGGSYYYFETENERENFINYLKTDFCRFCLSLYKTSKNLLSGELEIIPWLDFTEEWDDDKLFAKFDVSQELQDYIRDFLPDYYGIRK
jgi:16S rRNA G966 N2-methylase RsmD